MNQNLPTPKAQGDYEGSHRGVHNTVHLSENRKRVVKGWKKTPNRATANKSWSDWGPVSQKKESRFLGEVLKTGISWPWSDWEKTWSLEKKKKKKNKTMTKPMAEKDSPQFEVK